MALPTHLTLEVVTPAGLLLKEDVAEQFTQIPGKYVPLADSIRGFKMIVDGELDHIPEQAFFMVGPIEEVFEQAKAMEK